jgi:hypothetical protein
MTSEAPRALPGCYILVGREPVEELNLICRHEWMHTADQRVKLNVHSVGHGKITQSATLGA